jgi:hypothetical protein
MFPAYRLLVPHFLVIFRPSPLVDNVLARIFSLEVSLGIPLEDRQWCSILVQEELSAFGTEVSSSFFTTAGLH